MYVLYVVELHRKLHLYLLISISTYMCIYIGIINFFYRKDVRLPVQLQRAMAAEAEAAREARAKVYIFL